MFFVLMLQNYRILRQLPNFWEEYLAFLSFLRNFAIPPQPLLTMKKKFSIIVLLVIAIMTTNAQLLYKISGKGLSAPSYIVGTYHLAPASFADSIPGIRQAMMLPGPKGVLNQLRESGYDVEPMK